MCIPGLDPATLSAIVSAIAVTAGTATQYSAQKSANKATDQAAAQSLIEQQRIRDEANKSFGKTTDAYAPGAQKQSLDALQKTRQTAYDSAIYPAAAGSYDAPAPGAGGPSVVADVRGIQSARAAGGAQREGAARATFESLGDLFLKNGLFSARQAEEAQRLNTNSQTLGGLLQGAVAAAQRKAISPGGDALVALGSIGLQDYAGRDGGTPGPVKPKTYKPPIRATGSGAVGNFQGGLY